MTETDPRLGLASTDAGETGVHEQLVRGAVRDRGVTLNETIRRAVVEWGPAVDELAQVRRDIERDRAELARTAAALLSRLDLRSRVRAKVGRIGGAALPLAAVAAGVAAGLILRRARRGCPPGPGGA
ncbi:DUF3618 domain-containing protein [Microtetraspora niveoalba]|uniref:DUF3618 domain-containing protein n=1 Tax=Microtetraspora niveoalba TaxID=46175 RepID=UPI00082BA8AB|nr:DUF3618 domain-containing protein [Microtetraspora niveoalba]